MFYEPYPHLHAAKVDHIKRSANNVYVQNMMAKKWLHKVVRGFGYGRFDGDGNGGGGKMNAEAWKTLDAMGRR